jgi:long-chain acyl-CoA synthetase
MSAPIPPGTLTQLFFDTVERFGYKDACYRCKAAGAWHTYTHQDVLRKVTHTALALKRLGVRRGDRVAILAENRPGWAIADYACLSLGAPSVPIYPSLPPTQIRFILADSGAKAIFVSTAPQTAKIREIRAELPALVHVMAMSADAVGDGVIGWKEVYALGEEAERAGEGKDFRAEALTARPDDLATIIYTSGTTGDPKGVMLSHDNIWFNVKSALIAFDLGPEDITLSFLPLSHIFERMVGHYALFSVGATINYAENMDTVPQDIADVRPTFVSSVPRLYEKIYARAFENARAGGLVRTRIFFWAKGVGDRWAEAVIAGRTPPLLTRLQYPLAAKLVFSKMQARTGGRMRFFVSGGAPLEPDIAKFFFGAGLPIYEGYGLTETSPLITANLPRAMRLGTVGRAITGVEVRIEEDGEILTRGRHVMKGYYKNPEATADVLLADGWFRTGDIGEMDADGYLRITDRKKDLIVTAGGKNVAPQPIEGLAKRSKYVANAVMLGDKRKFCIMLVVPHFEQLERWANYRKLVYADHNGLIRLPLAQAKMEKEVFRHLEGLASYEMPKRILLLEHDFTIESGDLTPTLKVRRRVVERTYQRRIDAVYAEAPATVD